MNLFSRKSITDWVEEARRTDGLLIDVRTPEEYDEGHIPGSVNPVSYTHLDVYKRQ